MDFETIAILALGGMIGLCVLGAIREFIWRKRYHTEKESCDEWNKAAGEWQYSFTFEAKQKKALQSIRLEMVSRFQKITKITRSPRIKALCQNVDMYGSGLDIDKMSTLSAEKCLIEGHITLPSIGLSKHERELLYGKKEKDE